MSAASHILTVLPIALDTPLALDSLSSRKGQILAVLFSSLLARGAILPCVKADLLVCTDV